jgi:phage-related protein
MAIGFSDGANTHIPDRSMARRNKPRVLLAQFGDGYEQRLPLGINSLQEEYSVTFKTRPKADIDDMTAFFDTAKGANNFTFTIPDTNAGGNEKAIKVVCDAYSMSFEYDNYYTLEAIFRRVYEP